MPDFVKESLLQRGSMELYRSRPAYQQNDYVGWILRAKRKETQEKRLVQMLDELEHGDKYMKMAYSVKKGIYIKIERANTASTGQVRAFAHTFGESAPTADSASGGFVRQIPHLPVTPVVGQFLA